MKKLMMIFAVQLVTMTVSAQVPFVKYNPVIVDNNGNRVNTDGSSYNQNYNNQDYNSYNQYQQSTPKYQTVRGYYYSRSNDDWYSILARIEITKYRIRLVGTKGRFGWDECNYQVHELSPSEPQYIRDNFSYYALTSRFGRIHF